MHPRGIHLFIFIPLDAPWVMHRWDNSILVNFVTSSTYHHLVCLWGKVTRKQRFMVPKGNVLLAFAVGGSGGLETPTGMLGGGGLLTISKKRLVSPQVSIVSGYRSHRVLLLRFSTPPPPGHLHKRDVVVQNSDFHARLKISLICMEKIGQGTRMRKSGTRWWSRVPLVGCYPSNLHESFLGMNCIIQIIHDANRHFLFSLWITFPITRQHNPSGPSSLSTSSKPPRTDWQQTSPCSVHQFSFIR